MKKPLAVVISDIHYTLYTLEVADTALRMAIDKAAELEVALIDCGDLTDTKAIIRAEVMNKLLTTQEYARNKKVTVVSLVGNHSLCNERSTEENALGFLGYYDEGMDGNYESSWTVRSTPYDTYIKIPWSTDIMVGLIPYQPSSALFYEAIKQFPKGHIVFAHQGNIGGDTGDYIQDRSAVDPALLTDWRVFSGHYHAHYENKNWVSIGNPYTLTYGEAKDPDKGFLIVYDDGSYDHVLTHLRRHHVIEMTYEEIRDYPSSCAMEHPLYYVKPEDLLWLKVTGTRSELAKLSKRDLGKVIGKEDFKLDLIPLDDDKRTAVKKNLTAEQMLDKLVLETNETEAEKQYLKQLWRDLLSES